MSILYLFGIVVGLTVPSFDGHRFCMAEYLFATGKREFLNEFYSLCLLAIVAYLCLNEYRVTCSIVPDVDTERLDTYLISLYQTDRTENTEGLTAFREPPFTAASSTDPWRGCLHGRMVNIHSKLVLTVLQTICHVKCPYSATYQFLRIFMSVESHCGISAYTLEL
jgi:hypothetical protein